MSTAPLALREDDPGMPSAPAPAPARRPRLRVPAWLFPVTVSIAIVSWQLDFNADLPPPLGDSTMSASSGLLSDLRCFFYFYYHLGLFPVGAREVPRLGPTRQDALNFVAAHGRSLRMDFGQVQNTPRFGDYGKLFTLWPDAWLRGDPAHPSPRPFNQFLFITSLLAVWWAFWRERRVLLGTLIVLFAGSNPFQLYETFTRPNIFSLPISVTLLALAAHLPWLTGRRALDGRAWAVALISAILLATIREIRTEAVIVALALPATYLAMRAPLTQRLLLIGAFVVAWAAIGHTWTWYWSRGFQRSAQYVSRAGGQVFTGRHGYNHALWHAVYCGLGDYGGDRGFAWDDRAAYRWATTRDAQTNPHPLPYHYKDGYYLEETYDGVNHIAPTDLPEYNRLVRDRVVSAIRSDPLWYARILIQRAGAILGGATPAALSIGVARIGLSGVGWALIPIVLLLVLLQRSFELGLIAFTLPLSAVALLVYSGRGMANYGIAHLVAFAVVIDLLLRTRYAAFARRTHGA